MYNVGVSDIWHAIRLWNFQTPFDTIKPQIFDT